MTQQVATNDAAVGSGTGVFERVDSRAAALEEKFAAETRASSGVEESNDETAAPAPTGAPGGESAAAKPAAPAVDDESKFDRILKLEQESLRKSQAAKQRERDAEARFKAAEERAKKAEELEKLWAGADDNPDRILELLEQKVGPEKLVKWFGEQADPSKRAARVAEQEAKRGLSPIEERLKKIEDRERELEAKESRASGEKAFESHVEQMGADAPLTARMLKASRGEVISRADAIIDFFNAPKDKGGLGLRFGEDYNLVDVIQRVEGDLKRYRDALIEQAADKAEGSDKTATDDTKNPAPPAAAKANTVSNRAASDRTTLSNDAPKMSLDERIAAKIRGLRRQG